RDFSSGCLVSDRVHHIGGFQRQQASLFNFHARGRDVGTDGALFSERPAKSHARLHSFTHRFNGSLGNTDASHAMMDAPGTQSSLGNLESASFAEQDIRDRNPNVFKRDLAMAMWRMVVAKHR